MEKKESASHWAVEVSKDSKRLFAVALSPTETFLGRFPQNQIVLDHPSVSRSHALIQKNGEQFFITDQGSQNGFLINGRRTLRGEFREGDIVSIGPFSLKLKKMTPQEIAAAKKQTSEKG